MSAALRVPRRAAALAAVLLGATACAGAQRSGGRAHDLRLAVAEQLGAKGDWAGAYRAADALTREDPKDGAARLLRASALRHTGAVDEAGAALRDLLADEPRNAAAHAELAVLCERTRRSDEALAQHREALRLQPGSPRYLNNLGFALLLRGRAGEAVPLLEEALRADPADPRLRNNLGFALAATGDFSRASRQFQLAGTPADARNNLGVAYERAGNLLQAYDRYLEAVQIDASFETARGNLEHVGRELGRMLPGTGTVSGPRENGGS
jgi:Flp pilus assembly protein TadD